MALCLYIWYAYMCVCCIRQTQGFSLRVDGLIRGLVIAIFRCFSKEAKKAERNFNRMHVCIYKHERARVCIYVCLCLFVYLIKILALLCTLSIMCARWDGVYCVDFVCSPNVNFSTHIQIYFGNVDGPCPLCLRIKCEYTSNLNGTKPSISSHRMYTQYKVLDYLCLSVWCTNYVYVWHSHVYNIHSYSWNGSRRFTDQILLVLQLEIRSNEF